MKGFKYFASVIGKTVLGPSSVRYFYLWVSDKEKANHQDMSETSRSFGRQIFGVMRRIWRFLAARRVNIPNCSHSLKPTGNTVNHRAQTVADHRGLVKRRGQNEGGKIKEKAGG